MGVLISKFDGIGMGLFSGKKFLAIVMIGVLLWAGSAVSEQAESEEGSKLTLKQTDSDSGDPSDFNSGKEFIKMLLSVLLVIVLAIGVLYLSKKVLPKISKSSGRNIHVVETVHLAPRRSVHLIEIGDRQILIGSTNENITKLADITAANSDDGQEV